MSTTKYPHKLYPKLFVFTMISWQIWEKKHNFYYCRTTFWRRELKISKQGKDVAVKEMKQLNDRVVFEPISRDDFTEQEIKKAI